MENIEYLRMHAAEEQHWWYAGLHDLMIRWIRREASGRSPLDILDAGCGTGRLCQLMQPFGAVTGCDRHPRAIAATTNRGIAHVQQCDLVTDSLGMEKYDLIICADVLYHRAVTDVPAVLQNLRQALRYGGLLLVHVAAFEFLRGAHDVAVHTCRRYRRPELARRLQAAGFSIEFISYRLPLCIMPVLLWRCISRHRPTHGESHSDLAWKCSPGMNRWIKRLIQIENQLLLAGWRMPFGSSLFACARKKK
jgi:SAM-dependent methyltransferase